MRPLLALLLATVAASAGAAQSGDPQIDVTDPADVALTVAVDDAVDAATEAIGACAESRIELADCLCAHRDDLARIRASLDALLARNPGWEGRALFVADRGDGRSLNIWLDTVARSAKPPDCG